MFTLKNLARKGLRYVISGRHIHQLYLCGFPMFINSSLFDNKIDSKTLQMQADDDKQKATSSLTHWPLEDTREVIFKLILMIDNWGVLWSLDLTDDKSTLIQVMAWCRQAISHYLSQSWPRSMLPYGVNRPQWVNVSWSKQWPDDNFTSSSSFMDANAY